MEIVDSLCHGVFKKKFWGDIDDILKNVDEGKGVLFLKDFLVVRRHGHKEEKIFISSTIMSSWSYRKIAVVS